MYERFSWAVHIGFVLCRQSGSKEFRGLGVGAQGIWFSSEFSIGPFHCVSCAYDFGRIWAVCHGGLSQLWPLCGYPKYQVPYYKRDPKRDQNLTTTLNPKP